jgi:nitrate reductase (NAD(P)H)
LGAVSEKTAKFIKQSAEAAAKDQSKGEGEDNQVALQKHRWVPVKLIDRRSLTKDTRTYTFELPADKPELGLGTCQHLQVGFHLQDKMLVRPYTPTRPVMPSPRRQGNKHGSSQDATRGSKEPPNTQDNKDKNPPTPPASPPDGDGNDNNKNNPTFDLTVKTYSPTDAQPGGALSNLLDCMPLGEEVEIRGPTGDIVYTGNSEFLVSGPVGGGGGDSSGGTTDGPRKLRFPRVSLVLGGSGITPGYALMARIAQSGGEDKTEVRVVDANKSEADILLKEDLDRFEKESEGRIKVTHVLSQAEEGWTGEKGRVDAELLRKCLFPPGEGSAVFLCGPPGMIQKAALPALRGMSATFLLVR